MLDVEFVIAVHDEIIAELGGLPGFAAAGRGGVESALARVENHAYYNGLDDVFGIASMYAVAIAKGHVFNDANKRTGLTCALTYLDQQGIAIKEQPVLEDVMVEIAEGNISMEDFASILDAFSGDI